MLYIFGNFITQALLWERNKPFFCPGSCDEINATTKSQNKIITAALRAAILKILHDKRLLQIPCNMLEVPDATNVAI